ncbi:MAG: zinc-responsive transcriptional regulator [Methanosaeta sp. PtaU1.Bin112]|nr:MAG: zinc-responsive transcriptional regulator [Methanosaeta sp. PtaU1.Bin112]
MTVDQIPITRFSIITRITPKALRYYDQLGLLVPAAKDTLTGYRYYTADQLEKGVAVKTLCSLGISLEEVACYLDAEAKGDLDALQAMREKYLYKTRSQIARLQRIEALLRQSDKELLKMALSDPVIKEVPAMRVASKREKGNYGETIGRLIGELCEMLVRPVNQKNHVKVSGPCMAIYHDEEYKENDADIEVAIPITGRIEVDEGMEVKTLPPARVLAVVHKGSYDTLILTYREIWDYMTKNGMELAGPGRELYLSDPCKTAPEELLTEIQLQIKEGPVKT